MPIVHQTLALIIVSVCFVIAAVDVISIYCFVVVVVVEDEDDENVVLL